MWGDENPIWLQHCTSRQGLSSCYPLSLAPSSCNAIPQRPMLGKLFLICLLPMPVSQPDVWECAWGHDGEGATCHCFTQLLLFNQLHKAHLVLADPYSSSQPVLLMKPVLSWPQNGLRRKGIPASAGSPSYDYKGNGRKVVSLDSFSTPSTPPQEDIHRTALDCFHLCIR